MEPYPSIANWRIPTDALQRTLEGVRSAGDRGKESGALWLGHRAFTAKVTAVVLPQGEGVIEAPDHWQIGPEVMAAITTWARPRGLVMLGMLHIHIGHSVALSWSDRHRVVQVPGMLSIVVGDAGREAISDLWGWYVYEAGGYRHLIPPERQQRIILDDNAACRAWQASVTGVHEL